MPTDLLETLAQAAVAFAGLSALSLVVVQLAGAPWRADMTTGLWLMVAWSFGVFAFSVLPLVLEAFGLPSGVVVSICSVGLGAFGLVVAGLALLRDTRLLRAGAPAPVMTMAIGGTLATVIGVGLILNGCAVLPGARGAWYVSGLFAYLLYAILPLVHFMLSVTDPE